MTLNTDVIKPFLRRGDQSSIALEGDLYLQIIPNLAYLPTCQKHQCAAFIQDIAILVVWDDDPSHIISRATKIEKQLMSIISRSLYSSEKVIGSKTNVVVSEIAEESGEDQAFIEKPRRVALFHSIIIALTLALTLAAIGGGWRQIAVQTVIDKSIMRLVFIAVVPLQMWLGLFFFQSIITNVAQIVGPISHTEKNSKFYSGIASVRSFQEKTHPLPHVTIQCPVFKEGLRSVITPTIKSLKAAISTYEMQGGSANIFVNDDGMQLMSQEDAQLRRDFYEEHNIGWVARPKHNTDAGNGEPLFVRAGRFKKASNLNYALGVSTRVEEKLAQYQRPRTWTEEDEQSAYFDSLQAVIDEDEQRTWADGNIRIGDYILLIDSDTRVPEDCLIDAVTEMEHSPEVAIIQFPSGILNVTQSFFENGISFFTSLVYISISYIVACGDIPPFVGHNAILRWSAIQEISFQGVASNAKPGESERVEMYWSEETVSEDFDMALRLQTVGYTIRLASYKGTDFKEGVSLTVYDELARWKKYAYGCSELIFHPLRYWFTRGPFTPIFRKFLTSGIPFSSKISILAYMGTYYAIAAAWLLITANFFLIGWYYTRLDHYYINSFEIFFSIIIVFSGLGNLSLAIYRYRVGNVSLLPALWQNFKWVILLYIFFGGMSMHISEAILSHLFSINMTWTATAKEVENTTFFLEVPKLIRKFKFMFAYCILMVAAMIYLANFAPPFWRINEFIAVFPLGVVVFSHFMLPIALNPSLMLFTW